MMIPKFIKPVLLSKRVPPVLTLLLSPIILALSIVVLTSRGDNSLERNFVVKINSSTILDNVLKVRPASTVTARSLPAADTSNEDGASKLQERQLFQLPGELGNLINPIASRIQDVAAPGATSTKLSAGSAAPAIPTSNDNAATNNTGNGNNPAGNLLGGLLGGNGQSTNGGNNALTNLLSGLLGGTGQGSSGAGNPLAGLLGGILGSNPSNTTTNSPLTNLLAGLLGDGPLKNIITTGPLGQVLGSLEGQAVTGLVGLANNAFKNAAAGAADQYSIYLTDICAANLTVGSQNQTLGPETCTPLRELAPQQTGPQPNSTVQIGSVVLDYSALILPAKLNGGSNILRLVFDFLQAFQIIGIVSTIFLLILSPFLIFVPFQKPALRIAAGIFATTASLTFMLVLIIESTLSSILPNIINQIGDGLGVSAKTSSSFIPMSAISYTFATVLSIVWTLHLIVSWHEKMYMRRDDKDDAFDFVRDARMRGLRRPIIRLNTPPDERFGDEKSFFKTDDEGRGEGFRAFMRGGKER